MNPLPPVLSAILLAALPVSGTALAQERNGILGSALAEQAAEAARRGDMEGEPEERVTASVLDNFVAIDTNGDRLLAPSEWTAWAGWDRRPPPPFESVDTNGSNYISYAEFEAAWRETGDERMVQAGHATPSPLDPPPEPEIDPAMDPALDPAAPDF